MSDKNQPIKPSVVIDIPPILEAFLRFATETPKDQTEIVVTRKTEFGKLINAFLSKSTKPPDHIPSENPVHILIPRTPHNWYSLETMYVYISREDQEQIIDRIEVFFNKWIDVFFQDGYAMNLCQLDIIESVLDILNQRMNTANFDQIKKRDYRKTKSEIRERSKRILRQRLSTA
ncbi:MAG TPA: hypothetical protein DCR40_10135 [Prolixibacteraceae bacterium]|uniref:Uncharacterized protein n=1 Tax=candidate division WS6 bacterium GW2011_GWF1_36_8 TaxID=1619098 RepID=A0A0G0F7Z7_9BACT|nr:MAG: hypothetical protein US29_C0045G0010 [candidate division WS6 bacterium GW2011_GWF1_36_8]KKQ19339.1 MAG: hypothetical protein US34_C0023G0013 [Candidatus Nomurabacteria bacterium GW2011_GWC2_36_9]HAQ19573.1 hypothetical protein [Prolixibacteraceae bacterium]